MAETNEAGLVRGIRRWDLVALIINSMVGAGIFVLPARAYALIGPYSLLAFVVCALVIALIILCFAEVGSRFKETGGPYLYARETFGPAAGFQVGWMFWLARLTSSAANCNLLVVYLGYFWPEATTGLWRAAVITAVMVALTAVNYVGVRDAAAVSNLFAVGKLVPLLVFAAVGFFFISPANFQAGELPGAGSFSTAVMLLVYAFTGFENASVPTGEVRDPRRELPIAILIAVAVVAVFYISIQAVCVGTLPGLGASERPVADAGRAFLGPAGASLIVAGAVVSIIGNLNAGVLTTSRLPFAMSEHGELPRALSNTHARFRTPHVSILLTGALLLGLTLWSSVLSALTLSTIARLLAYAATCLALPVLRRRADAPPAHFRAPFGAGVAVAALILCVWLLSQSTGREARDAGITVAFGLAVYAAFWLKRKGRER
ncbi:MAG TPA: amino acid permease [Pyrinomonadaceae bacterium]|nr:amino acid permease [Pyrinomonadaceae bacterium]